MYLDNETTKIVVCLTTTCIQEKVYLFLELLFNALSN